MPRNWRSPTKDRQQSVKINWKPKFWIHQKSTLMSTISEWIKRRFLACFRNLEQYPCCYKTSEKKTQKNSSCCYIFGLSEDWRAKIFLFPSFGKFVWISELCAWNLKLFLLYQKVETLARKCRSKSFEKQLWPALIFALKIFFFSAVRSWISSVQRFSGDERHWIRIETFLNSRWSALKVSRCHSGFFILRLNFRRMVWLFLLINNSNYFAQAIRSKNVLPHISTRGRKIIRSVWVFFFFFF